MHPLSLQVSRDLRLTRQPPGPPVLDLDPFRRRQLLQQLLVENLRGGLGSGAAGAGPRARLLLRTCLELVAVQVVEVEDQARGRRATGCYQPAKPRGDLLGPAGLRRGTCAPPKAAPSDRARQTRVPWGPTTWRRQRCACPGTGARAAAAPAPTRAGPRRTSGWKGSGFANSRFEKLVGFNPAVPYLLLSMMMSRRWVRPSKPE